MGFVAELQRRNVVRVAIFYIVASWLALQVADIVLPAVGAPDWVLRVLLAALGIAFIPALIFAWAYELTPEGIKREKDVDRSQSVTHHTAKKLDIAVIILLVGVAILTFMVPRYTSAPAVQPGPTAETASPPAAPAASPQTVNDRIGIAVLPFANLSGNDEATPFASGLHDDLLTHLSRIDALRVISRTSVLEYAGTTKNVRTIGEELGVSHLMEGGIQRAGDRVRINIQLINAQTDEHLWANTFDRELTVENIFDIQSAIAQEIAAQLRINLAGDGETRFERPTENLAAYEAYLLGRSELNLTDTSTESLLRAQEHFERALELDPAFAEAYAGLALISDTFFWFHGRNARKRQEGLEFAERALDLKPGLPEAIRAQAIIYYHGYLDYDRALEALDRVRESLDGEVWTLVTRAAVYRRSGDFAASIPIFEQALTVSPRSPLFHLDLINSYMLENRYDDALEVTRRLAELDVDPMVVLFEQGQIEWNRAAETTTLERLADQQDITRTGFTNDSWLPSILSALWAAGRQGDIEPFLDRVEATGLTTREPLPALRARFNLSFDREELESDLEKLQAAVLGGDLEPIYKFQIAEALTHLGRNQEAIELLNRLANDPLVTRDRVQGPRMIARAAYLFTRLGEVDLAMDALETTLEAAIGQCLRSLVQIPGMEQLESHPKFAELVERYGWVEEDRSQGVSL